MIDESFHIPVLTEEVIEHLIRKKDGHYLDATAGFGGHSSAILEGLDNGSLLSLIHISEPTRPERIGGGRVWV